MATQTRSTLAIVLLLGCAVLIGGVVGTAVSRHVFESLRHLGDPGGPTYTPPLVLLFAGIAAVATFFGVVMTSVAVVSPVALAIARPWRAHRAGDTDYSSR
jgi:hypothetical protein